MTDASRSPAPSGFIGRHVVAHLAARGDRTVVAGRAGRSSAATLAARAPRRRRGRPSGGRRLGAARSATTSPRTSTARAPSPKRRATAGVPVRARLEPGRRRPGAAARAAVRRRSAGADHRLRPQQARRRARRRSGCAACAGPRCGPGVVYGPGDRALLPLFRMAARGILPLVGRAGRRLHLHSRRRSGARDRRGGRQPVDRRSHFRRASAAGDGSRARSKAIRAAAGGARARSSGSRCRLTRVAALVGDVAGALLGRPHGDQLHGATWSWRRRASSAASIDCASGSASSPRWICTTGWRRRRSGTDGKAGSRRHKHVDIKTKRLKTKDETKDIRQQPQDGNCLWSFVLSLESTVSWFYDSATPVTPSSAPTRPKMSSARVRCSAVCAAEQLARSTQSSTGQPGGTIRFT